MGVHRTYGLAGPLVAIGGVLDEVELDVDVESLVDDFDFDSA